MRNRRLRVAVMEAISLHLGYEENNIGMRRRTSAILVRSLAASTKPQKKDGPDANRDERAG